MLHFAEPSGPLVFRLQCLSVCPAFWLFFGVDRFGLFAVLPFIFRGPVRLQGPRSHPPNRKCLLGLFLHPLCFQLPFSWARFLCIRLFDSVRCWPSLLPPFPPVACPPIFPASAPNLLCVQSVDKCFFGFFGNPPPPWLPDFCSEGRCRTLLKCPNFLLWATGFPHNCKVPVGVLCFVAVLLFSFFRFPVFILVPKGLQVFYVSPFLRSNDPLRSSPINPPRESRTLVCSLLGKQHPQSSGCTLALAEGLAMLPLFQENAPPPFPL